MFIALNALPVCLAVLSLVSLFRAAQRSEAYSHIVLIPLVSGWLLFRHRKEIFHTNGRSSWTGAPFMAAGIALLALGYALPLSPNDASSAAAAAAVVFMWGSYLAVFGPDRWKRAFFPFAFLLFMAPLPDLLRERVLALLISGSIDVTGFLFRCLGIRYIREGAVFRLPGFSIEVARECSGIRSSLALLITAVLAGHVFLKGTWRKALLALAVLPVALFKNGVRIVALYLLAYYVDMRFIEGGFLHRSGGFLFFGLGLAVLGLVLLALRRPRRRGKTEK